MKKIGYLLLILCVALSLVACPFINDGKDSWYFVYVTGDTDRTVQISYLEGRKKSSGRNDNDIITEPVTLPFSKRVSYISGIKSGDDVFLEVVSENDSTTEAIIFDDGLLLADSTCIVYAVWETANATNECAYCKDMSKDSVLRYLKSIDYPCYLEFSKGETVKRVRLWDYWRPSE
jgi:hypothetical protein